MKLVNLARYRRYFMLIATMLVASMSVADAVAADYQRPLFTQKHIRLLLQEVYTSVGVPYIPSGTNPEVGFDCSGLVYYAMQQIGMRVPRNSHDQYLASRPVSKNALQAGDLVFFRTRGRGVSHVGIYIGNNRFVHAFSSGKPATITSLSASYWSARFVRGGRFV
ncbi:MAG: hypothetical protein RIS84_1509 [Pseudomonadota bacterium]